MPEESHLGKTFVGTAGHRLTFAFSSPMLSGVDKQKETGALLIAASIIAAIRLRGEPVVRSPKVMATIADSVQLARLVLQELER